MEKENKDYFYSIFINTCDKFEDCWNPFFRLLEIYWPDCRGKIYLNTEYKKYNYKNSNIISVQGSAQNNIPKLKSATWSECLYWGIEKVSTDIVLYLQEDYFLKDYVKNSIIEHYVKLMIENENIACIHLTDQAVEANGKSYYKNLNKVKTHQRYRVSCQAALWRKNELLKLIRSYENAWEFEEFGSKRSALMGHEYYVVDNDFVKLNEYEIIPYIFTGIIQGRWYEETIPLFEKHNIVIDYSGRGFFKDKPDKLFKQKVIYKIRKIVKIFRNQIELINLKRTINKRIL